YVVWQFKWRSEREVRGQKLRHHCHLLRMAHVARICIVEAKYIPPSLGEQLPKPQRGRRVSEICVGVPDRTRHRATSHESPVVMEGRGDREISRVPELVGGGRQDLGMQRLIDLLQHALAER